MTISRAECKRDCGVRLHAIPRPGIYDGAEGAIRGPPAYVFVYLFIYLANSMQVGYRSVERCDGQWDENRQGRFPQGEYRAQEGFHDHPGQSAAR
jgi:hypothetical protein